MADDKQPYPTVECIMCAGWGTVGHVPGVGWRCETCRGAGRVPACPECAGEGCKACNESGALYTPSGGAHGREW